MKKLLSILAAVGLTATASASVVACGNKDPETKPQIVDLLKDKLELGKVKTKTEALTKAQTEVDKIDKLKGHVKLDDTVAGQIKVTTTDDTLSGEATFTYQLEWTIIQANISNIKITNIYVGMSETEYQPIIQEAINQLISGTQFNQDYTIEGSTSHGGKNKITVAATSGSNLITGQFQIDILMIEMDNAQINIGDWGMVEKTIENWDQLENVQAKLKMDEEKADAFSHVEVSDKQVRFTVDRTTKIEAVFTGIITVTANHVEPVEIAVQVIKHVIRDIADVLKEKVNLGYFLTDNDAKVQAESIIAKILELAGKVILDPPNNGQIHVTANDPYLTGSTDFKYQLKKHIEPLIKQKNLIAVKDENEVINIVLDANKDSGLTNQDIQVEPGSFVGSAPGVTGQAVIKAASAPYTGEAKVTFKALDPIPLIKKLPNHTNLPAATSKEEMINVVLEANKGSGLTANDLKVQEGYIPSAPEIPGSATIESTNVAYTGTVKATFEILRKIEIKIDETDANVTTGQDPVKLKIKNFSKLTNLRVESNDENKATAKIVGEDVEITGVAPEKTSVGVIVKADNANDKFITINIYIQVEKVDTGTTETANVLVGGTENINILNYENLTGIKVELNKEKKVSWKLVTGGIELTGQEEDIEGDLTLTISATNAKQKAIVHLTVNSQDKDIKIDKSNEIELSLSKNKEKPLEIKITNLEKLKNVKIMIIDKEIVEMTSELDFKSKIFKIKPGKKANSGVGTQIKIKSEYTGKYILTVTVKIIA